MDHLSSGKPNMKGHVMHREIFKAIMLCSSLLIGTAATASEYRPALWNIGVPDNDWFDVLGDTRGSFAPASIKLGSGGMTVQNVNVSRETPGPQGLWQTIRERELNTRSGKAKYACVKLLNGGSTVEMKMQNFTVASYSNPRDCFGGASKRGSWEPAVHSYGPDGHLFVTLDPLGLSQARSYNAFTIKVGSATIGRLGNDIVSLAWNNNVRQHSSVARGDIVCIRMKNFNQNRTVIVMSKAQATGSRMGANLPAVVNEPTDCYKH